MIINFIFPFRRLKVDTLIHSEPRLQVPSYYQPDCGSLTTAVLLWCTSFHREYPEMRLLICSGVSSTLKTVHSGSLPMTSSVRSGHDSGPDFSDSVMM